MKRTPIVLAMAAAALSLALPARLVAQFGYPPPERPANPRLTAPLDLTGNWVSVVTEDWRYRMITPDKGDYSSVPLNSEGKRVADTWDPASDEASGNQCKSYGAAAIMRMPAHLHITWENDTTLRIDIDVGTQTRLLHFGESPPQPAVPQWQGYSVASWEGLRPHGGANLRGFGAAPGEAPAREGYLKVTTAQLRPGYLRRNGVPYSANAVVEEFFDGFKAPDGQMWLVVTTIVIDPQYLSEPFITSSHFKKLPDASGWNSSACTSK